MAAISFAGGQRTQSQPAVKQVVLHFPSDRSLGKLYLLKAVNPGTPKLRISDFTQAKGNVKVPAGTKLMLQISYQGALDLKPLANCLEQDVIYSIDASHVDNVSDQNLPDIAKLKSVKELLLTDTEVTDKGAQSIGTMAQLVHLNLGQTMITSKGLNSLRSLTALDKLDLGDLSIKGTDLACLVPMVHLKNLDLARTRLGNNAMKNLSKVSTLVNLRLSKNLDITDEGVSVLANLKNLRELNLVGCGVTKKCVATLQKMTNLKEVALSLPAQDLAQIQKSLDKSHPGCQVQGILSKTDAEFFQP